MSKLPRPHIPLAVRLLVAERQAREIETMMPMSHHAIIDAIINGPGTDTLKLRSLLDILTNCNGGKRLELHHRPALLNREQVKILGVVVGYIPDANDHRHLVYLPEDEHDIETRVRGQGAQLSDLGQARKNKKIEKRLAGEGRRGPPLRSANRWPPKGSRKINWRANHGK